MSRLLIRIYKDQSGSAALELALAIPLFFVLIFATIDIFKILLAEEQLERLARDLAFHYKYEVSTDSKTDLKQDDLVAKAKALTASSPSFLISNETLTATSEVYADLADYASGQVESTGNLVGLSGQIVIYRLEFDLSLTSPLLMLVHEGQVAPVTAFSIVKNGQ